MNYSKLLKSLTNEINQNAKIKEFNTFPRILLTILFIPFFLAFFFSRIWFWLSIFFYKMISAPAEYLQKWLEEQKDGVQHATQAVMYFVCLPTVFGFQVALSFAAISFYMQWFGLQILAYIITLGETKWQPFITDAKFED